MKLQKKLEQEQQWHDCGEFTRDNSGLIVRVYASRVFEEAETCLLEALEPVDGRKILDYGSGTGGTAEHLARRGALVTGFDISHVRLQVATERLSKAGLGGSARFLISAAETLPFAEGSFDAILGKQILHHLDLSLAIPEIARVLRPGGRAVFLEPLIHNPLLEGYRRLTPHLRSPTERALSVTDIQAIGKHFRTLRTKEFCLFAVLPILVGAVTRPLPMFNRASAALQRFDRRLMDRFPFIGRYAWETVIVAEK